MDTGWAVEKIELKQGVPLLFLMMAAFVNALSACILLVNVGSELRTL